MPDHHFQNKVMIITGAGGNFGRSGCLFFLRNGARIAALDVNEKALNETIAVVRTDPEDTTIKGYPCDVTNPASVDSVVACIVSDFGRIDLLWNNAGYQGQIKPTLDYDPADFARVMNINVTGMFIVLQSVARQMSRQHAEEGKAEDKDATTSHPYSIVNTASVAGLRGTPAMVAYSSSKAAILAMTVSSAKDLAPHGIRVNAISPALIGPGFMWTRQNELHAASGSPYFPSDADEVAKAKIGG
jgi:NAD(P)-dependent dehydrogenase (short-subunit alcohol dehydrogenase family)